MKNKIRKTVDDALLHVSRKENRHMIEEALKIYLSPFGEQQVELDKEHGFNSWLIHDYASVVDSPLLEKFYEDSLMKETIEKSVYSIFKVVVETKQIVFKDVITSVDYIIDDDHLYNAGDLVKIRLYPVEDKWVMLDNPEYLEPSMETLVRKSVMSKYNAYCSMNEPMHIEVFVKTQSQLIYHLTNIIDFYEAELEDEDEYQVHVATYAMKDKEVLLDLLLDSDEFQMIEVDGDNTIVHMLSDDIQLAELVISHDRVEIESTSKSCLGLVRDAFERLLGASATFLKEEMLRLDDLL